MTQSPDEFSIKRGWERTIARLPYFYVSVLLWVMAVALYCLPKISYLTLYVPWLATIFHPIGESLIVAGILVLLIDPFLKERLLREASKGIFHYLLGFDQQPEIKTRLRALVFDTKLFRKNFCLRCVLVPENGKVCLNMDVSFEVFNPTDEVQRYRHATQFERVESPNVHVLALISTAVSYSKNDIALKPKSDDTEVLEAEAGPIDIEPSAKGISYRFSGKFSLVYPEEFFYAVHVGTPTIGMRIEITPPKGFRVTASQTPTSTEDVWEYERLFMPGEHIDFRWEREISN
jgi:hypothetical protein